MSVTEVFAKYAKDDVLNLDGIVELAEEQLKIDLGTDIAFYILAWKLKAVTPTSISKSEWDTGMQALGCKTINDIIKRLDSLRAEIAVKTNFMDFYKWLFAWSKENKTARFIKKYAAHANWELLFKYFPSTSERWVHADDWLKFIEEKYTPTTITEDLWVQLMVWISTPGSSNLENFEEDAAWPTAIDQFVAWKVSGKK